MVDTLLSKADKEEELSRIYARAVAAGAGYVTSVPEYDRDGVDLQIRAGGHMRPAIDLQLKATINLEDKGEEHFRYPLPVRTSTSCAKTRRRRACWWCWHYQGKRGAG